MEAGAKGCQVIIAGKLTGARHRTEKFTEGHVKYCGEVAREVMNHGYAIAKLKAGVLGVKVRIMKPDAVLPDEIKLRIPQEEKQKEEKKIETKKEDKPVEKKVTPLKNLAEIQGIGPSIVKKFEKAGINSLEEIFEMDVDDIASIKGIGGKTAENILKSLKKILEEVA
jgi:small subunit ribosomal protein S3